MRSYHRPLARVMRFSLLAALLIVGAAHAAEGLSTPAPADAQVYFISPQDGATVGERVTVRFGLRGMGVAPAGVEVANTGHHHLLIDDPEVDLSLPLPASAAVVHFGKGQTEAVVTLPPGTHELQLLLGNHLHVPHTPPVRSETITVQVVADPE